MDWTLAVERWRVPLLGHVMDLFEKIGLTEGARIERVPKPLHRYVLGILRTVESAARRLIIAAARNIVVEPRPKRPLVPKKPKAPDKKSAEGRETGKAKRKRRPSFNLFDPERNPDMAFLRRFRKKRRPTPKITIIELGYDRGRPTIHLHGELRTTAPVPDVKKPVDDGMVNAGPLIRRLIAVAEALKDIPRYAMRYALWWNTPIEDRHPQRESALRPGRPPGFRQRAKHEVDEILKECHWLARNVMPQLDDTS